MQPFSIALRRNCFPRIYSTMSQQTPRLYSAAAGGSSTHSKPTPTTSQTPHQAQGQGPKQPTQGPKQPPQAPGKGNHHPQKRAPSPSHVPKTSSPEDSVYVLTLLTDSTHHATLTRTRKQYFPARLNKLDAHITLFHALPGSKLDTAILPTLKEVSSTTAPFPLLAATPFRLNKGIAIGLPKSQGGDAARGVHGRLKAAWKEFLSNQDAGGFAAHYTVMNKVDDQDEVRRAFEEVEGSWKGCRGTVEGLSLFRYDRGRWVHEEDFRFTAE